MQLISEQVSHHPPITAYRINTPYNIHLTGYNGADLTFKSSGSIVVKQTGHAQLVITLPDNTRETYYVTLPELKIQGLLAFSPYVELDKKTYILSSTGYLSTISYTGAGWVSGTKNSFTATLSKDGKQLYKVSGQWTGESTYSSLVNSAKKDMPFWNAKINAPTHVVVAPVEKQSPWESRKVWGKVAEAINKNDFEAAGRYKNAIEIAQRKMREEEQNSAQEWKSRFFKWVEKDETACELQAQLAALTKDAKLDVEVGSWVFAPDEEDAKAIDSGKLFEGA